MKSLYKFIVFIMIIMTVILILVNTQENIKSNREENAIPPVPDKIKTTVKLYFIQGNELVEEKRTIILKDKYIEKEIVEELIIGPRNKTLLSPLPKNTKVISAETIEGVCYLNLSKEFINSSIWDTLDEQLIIWSIVNSITELDYVESVQFLIEGEKMAFVLQEYSFEVPFIPNKELIRKNKNTPFGVVKEFLNNILEARYDEAYIMLSKESRNNVSFRDFKSIYSNYVKKLENYDIFTYHTQQFSGYVKVTITYVFSGVEGFDYNKKFKEDWKLIKEDDVWKIIITR